MNKVKLEKSEMIVSAKRAGEGDLTTKETAEL